MNFDLVFLLSSLVLIAGAFMLARGLAVILLQHDGSRSATEYRAMSGKKVLTVYTIVGAFLLVNAFPPGEHAAQTLSTTAPVQAVSVGTNVFAMTVIAVAGIVAVERGIAPIAHALRPGEITIPVWLRRRIRYATVGAVLAVAVVFEVIVAGILPVGPQWIIPVGCALVVGIYYPIAALGGRVRARDPTDEERERIERCYDRFGRSPMRIVVSESDRTPTGPVVRGIGTPRSLVVSTSFLEAVTDEELTVALAQTDERTRRYYWIFYWWTVAFLLPTYLLGLSAIYLVLSDGMRPEYYAVMATLLTLILVFGWLARRSVRPADQYASDQLGAETVTGVYERLGDDLSFMSVESWKRIPGMHILGPYVWPEPSIDHRIERLGDEAPTDRAAADGRERPAN